MDESLTVSVQATDLLIALRHVPAAVPPADLAAIGRLRAAAHNAAAHSGGRDGDDS